MKVNTETAYRKVCYSICRVFVDISLWAMGFEQQTVGDEVSNLVVLVITRKKQKEKNSDHKGKGIEFEMSPEEVKGKNFLPVTEDLCGQTT